MIGRVELSQRPEADYRAVAFDSPSSLKDFVTDRRKYYRKHILKEDIKEKDNHANKMGKLVETLWLEPEQFDNKFYLTSATKAPGGMMGDFVSALVDLLSKSKDENGDMTKSFADCTREAYALSGYAIAYEAVLKKFMGSDAEIYFNEMLEVQSKGLEIVTANDITMAEAIVEGVKTSSHTSFYANVESSERFTVLNQFQTCDFKIDDYRLKGMQDRVIIDHQEKTITILDAKCTWNVENFYKDYYLYRRSYIQGYVYWRAWNSIVNDTEGEYYGYIVHPPKFIVVDSGNFYKPLVYAMSKEELTRAYNGFTFDGVEYQGVRSIIEDLKWARENSTWNVSKTNSLNNGEVIL